MAASTMASRLVNAADLLLQNGRRSTAFRRRAVSTAYYAVFHALARLCADYLTRSAARSSDEYERVYRALEHGPLKQAFLRAPLKDNQRLSEIGVSVVRLQAERFRADYLPPVLGVFGRAEAEELVGLARETVTQIELLSPRMHDTRILATALHFGLNRRG
jgi:hypothetical protein